MADDPTFPPGIAYIEGRFVPMSEARLPVLDWGFLRSDATYDVVHVWQGRFFRLDAHLDRFLRSVDRLRMSLPVDRDRLAAILAECVRRSGHEDAYVEMICTRGMSPTFSRDPRDAENRFIAFAIPFGWIANAEQRKRGLHVAISKTAVRIPPASVDPTVKNYHWLDLVMGLFEAYDEGRETVFLTDGEGHVTEGAGFNIFAVEAGRVLTPRVGVLEGITRKTTLELCAALGIACEPVLLEADRLRRADEVFVTSTAGGIMPVTRIDGAAVASGAVGPITRNVHDLYWEKHSDPAWTTAVAALPFAEAIGR